jgi:hypothetical protein
MISIKESFDLKIILKYFPMLDIVRYRGSLFHFYIILEFGWHKDSEITC